MTYSINQIVRGKVAGVFVIVGTHPERPGIPAGYAVRAVNPANLSETAPGEMLFTADMLRPYA